MSNLPQSLLEDATRSLHALNALPLHSPATQYFKYSGVVHIPQNTSVMDTCRLMLSSPYVAILNDAQQTEHNTWLHTVSYTVLEATSHKVHVECVAQSEEKRATWCALKEPSTTIVPAHILIRMELEAGEILFLAPGMLWRVSEGLLKTYTLKMAHAKLKTAEECFAKLAALKERIALIDKRKWNPQGPNAKSIQAAEATPIEKFDKKLIDNFAKSLGTLETHIFEAERNTTLHTILSELEEVRVILDTKFAHVRQTTQTARRKRYDDFMATEYNLVGKAKAVHDLLADVKMLSESTPGSATRINVTREDASSLVVGASAPNIVVPEIDESALTPFVIDHADGPDGLKKVLVDHKENKAKFATMVASLKNEAVTALHQKWLDASAHVQQQQLEAQRDSGNASIDVTLYVAYADALKKIYDETKGSTTTTISQAVFVPPTATNKPRSNGTAKTIKCGNCEARRREFAGTGLCKECFRDDVLCHDIDTLDARAALLVRQVEREEDANGPLHKLNDEYDDVHERLIVAYETFDKPNSSAAAWEELKELMTRADAMLPIKKGQKMRVINSARPHAGGEEGGGDDDEEEFGSDDAAGVDSGVEHSDEDDDEESASSSPSRSAKKKKRSSSSTKDDDLAHEALETLHRLPVASVHESILDNYHNKRYVLVEEELKRLKQVDEVYTFTVQSFHKNEKGEVIEDEPEEWHTSFLKRADAVKLANATAVPDRIRTRVVNKRVEREEESDDVKIHEDSHDHKKSKKDDE